MSFDIIHNGKPVVQEWIQFSDGTKNLKITFDKRGSLFDIRQDLRRGVGDIWDLALIVSAIRKATSYPCISLTMPYLPHARADRVFEDGNAFPLQAFLELVASLQFDVVYIEDPHSNFFREFDKKINFNVQTQADLFLKSYRHKLIGRTVVLVCPDKGALLKTCHLQRRLASQYDIATTVMVCSKTRDVSTGKITSFDIPDDTPQDAFHILVDDICDGGGTFLPIAAALRERGVQEIDLFISHGIFTKGLLPFQDLYDQIYVHNIVGNYITRDELDIFNQRRKIYVP